MKYQIAPLFCRPWTLLGITPRLIESHYENNYGGAFTGLNAISEELDPTHDTNRKHKCAHGDAAASRPDSMRGASMTKVIAHRFKRRTTHPAHGVQIIMSRLSLCLAGTTALILCASLTTGARAAPVEPVQTLAAKEKAPLLATLKDLVAIESGSGDREGLDKIAAL